MYNVFGSLLIFKIHMENIYAVYITLHKLWPNTFLCNLVHQGRKQICKNTTVNAKSLEILVAESLYISDQLI